MRLGGRIAETDYGMSASLLAKTTHTQWLTRVQKIEKIYILKFNATIIKMYSFHTQDLSAIQT